MDTTFQQEFAQLIADKSDEELREIYLRQKEYQPEFVTLAVAELNRRNISAPVLNSDTEQEQEDDIIGSPQMQNAKNKGEGKEAGSLMVWGFFFAIVWGFGTKYLYGTDNIAGSIVAIAIGARYAWLRNWSGKRKRYVYKSDARTMGKIMIVLAVFSALFGLLAGGHLSSSN